MSGAPIELIELCRPEEIGSSDIEGLASCWVEVTNAGGAVGFPRPPITFGEAVSALHRLIARLEPLRTHVLVARAAGRVAGWVTVEGNADPLVSHWATVRHLQVRPEFRGNGLGRDMMLRSAETAREVMGLVQLHLAVRSGQGLEAFYVRLGWREVGRWPGALHFPDDVRDEVLFLLELS